MQRKSVSIYVQLEDHLDIEHNQFEQMFDHPLVPEG